jgi:hypothetical protein
MQMPVTLQEKYINSILDLLTCLYYSNGQCLYYEIFWICDYKNQVTQTHYEADAYPITHVP